MKRILLLPEAYLDLEEAKNYYDEQKEGLGTEFILAVQNSLHEISIHPLQFQVIYKNDRKCNLHRFPYAVIYKVRKNDIAMKAVAHLMRHPRS
ncbi:MAG: type II toxin-antitoxin system RelE/ParE family toxin [Bacteroidetes bacterium]|nr:type II toxin-antitoxin system RelE/ParE family toxin [Bacteroidota bacterium]